MKTLKTLLVALVLLTSCKIYEPEKPDNIFAGTTWHMQDNRFLYDLTFSNNTFMIVEYLENLALIDVFKGKYTIMYNSGVAFMTFDNHTSPTYSAVIDGERLILTNLTTKEKIYYERKE